MSQFVIKMPDIGEGIAEVEIVEWHVDVGDQVTEDQVLADVMTDKASVEIPSSVAGTIISLGGNVGDILAVGADLITIATAGAATAEPVATVPKAEAAKPVEVPASAAAPIQSVAADKPLVSIPAVASIAGQSTKVLASPSVRRRARQLEINLSDIKANNNAPISHSDLDNYLLSQTSGSSVITSVAPKQTNHYMHELADQQINVVGLRRQIAQKMQESKRNIPHFSYVEEVDVTELERLRVELNNNLHEGQARLTILPFLIRAMVLAVRKHPEINARYNDQEGVITQHGAVHMGVATQTDRGLMVPVIRNANTLDVWECAAQVSALANATRSGKAQRDELSGSTITLTSLGALGGIVSTPIINHPEVAIVGVNKIVERLVLQNGNPVARKIMNLSSSFDHRVVDGMQAALFIQEIRRLLECPALLFVDGHP